MKTPADQPWKGPQGHDSGDDTGASRDAWSADREPEDSSGPDAERVRTGSSDARSSDARSSDARSSNSPWSFPDRERSPRGDVKVAGHRIDDTPGSAPAWWETIPEGEGEKTIEFELDFAEQRTHPQAESHQPHPAPGSTPAAYPGWRNATETMPYEVLVAGGTADMPSTSTGPSRYDPPTARVGRHSVTGPTESLHGPYHLATPTGSHAAPYGTGQVADGQAASAAASTGSNVAATPAQAAMGPAETVPGGRAPDRADGGSSASAGASASPAKGSAAAGTSGGADVPGSPVGPGSPGAPGAPGAPGGPGSPGAPGGPGGPGVPPYGGPPPFPPPAGGYPQGGRPRQEPGGGGLATAALILGIASIFLLPIFGIGVLFAVVGIILGIVAATKRAGRGRAIVGIILSAVTLCLAIVGVVWFTTTFGDCMNMPTQDLMQRCIESKLGGQSPPAS